MRVEPSKKILDNQIAVVYHIAIHLYIEKGIALQGVHVIVLRRAVSRAREGNTLEADAIELLSLPLAINRVNVQQKRHSWPSVGAAILLRPFSHNTPSHLCKKRLCWPMALAKKERKMVN